MGTTIQNASPASPLPVPPSAVTCSVPLDALPSDQSSSLVSPAAKNVESFPHSEGHLPLVQCSLDANFGI